MQIRGSGAILPVTDLLSDDCVAERTAFLFGEPQNDALVAKYVLQNKRRKVGQYFVQQVLQVSCKNKHANTVYLTEQSLRLFEIFLTDGTNVSDFTAQTPSDGRAWVLHGKREQNKL